MKRNRGSDASDPAANDANV